MFFKFLRNSYSPLFFSFVLLSLNSTSQTTFEKNPVLSNIGIDSNSKNFVTLRTPMEGNPGFFIDDWKEKKNPKITYSKTTLVSQKSATVYAEVDFSEPLVKISKYIFGNNLGHWTNRKMLSNVEIIELKETQDIIPAYKYAYEYPKKKAFLIVEFADNYNE